MYGSEHYFKQIIFRQTCDVGKLLHKCRRKERTSATTFELFKQHFIMFVVYLKFFRHSSKVQPI